MALTRQGLSLEEFLALPEAKPALEYVEGVVTRKVAPKYEHSALQGELVLFFDRLLRPGRLGRALPELRTTYGGEERSYVPDVSVYSWDRVPRTPSGRPQSDFFVPPDIAVEIISPRQSRRALIARCEWYVAHGVRAALLIDHHDETIRVFRPGQPARIYGVGDQIDLTDLFPGMVLVVAELFAALNMD